jgi:hypothetical protein
LIFFIIHHEDYNQHSCSKKLTREKHKKLIYSKFYMTWEPVDMKTSGPRENHLFFSLDLIKNEQPCRNVIGQAAYDLTLIDQRREKA